MFVIAPPRIFALAIFALTIVPVAAVAQDCCGGSGGGPNAPVRSDTPHDSGEVADLQKNSTTNKFEFTGEVTSHPRLQKPTKVRITITYDSGQVDACGDFALDAMLKYKGDGFPIHTGQGEIKIQPIKVNTEVGEPTKFRVQVTTGS